MSLLGALLRELLDLGLGTGFVGLVLGDGVHPLAEAILVVEQIGDARLGVLVLGAPEKRVEGAHLDADAAVHAERVVDVEAVEGANRAGLAALAARRRLVLVSFDVDAPVGTAAGAEHADRAVLLEQGDDAAGPGGRRLLLVRVLDGVGAFGGARDELLRSLVREHRLRHLFEGDAEPLHETLSRDVGHQNTTFRIAVTKMLASESGIRTVHATRCNWSSRKRG